MNPALTFRLAAATLALTAFAGSACSASDTTATPAGASAAEVEPAPLCAKATPSADAASGEKVILSRGVGWTYDQLVPAGYDGGTPRPLVLALGDGGVTRAAARSVGEDAIVLAVDGPADGSGWVDSPAELRFVKDLLLRAETSLCFDRQAIYIVGSGGAQPVADRAVQDMPGSLRSL
jgi:hypothetical protein